MILKIYEKDGRKAPKRYAQKLTTQLCHESLKSPIVSYPSQPKSIQCICLYVQTHSCESLRSSGRHEQPAPSSVSFIDVLYDRVLCVLSTLEMLPWVFNEVCAFEPLLSALLFRADCVAASICFAVCSRIVRVYEWISMGD
jgi:hypothetical protein